MAVYDSINALGLDQEFWCREIDGLAPRTIIDFGCGTGLLTCELGRRGYHVIGTDLAGAMLEIARRKPHADRIVWIEGGYESLEGLRADLLLMTSHVAQFVLLDDDSAALLNTG